MFTSKVEHWDNFLGHDLPETNDKSSLISGRPMATNQGLVICRRARRGVTVIRKTLTLAGSFLQQCCQGRQLTLVFNDPAKLFKTQHVI